MDSSIWDLMSHGGYAMWVIVAFSVIAMAVAIERAIAQWRFTTRAKELADAVNRCLSRGATGEGRSCVVSSVTLPGGAPLDPAKRYRIALNGFDAQSGGRRYERLRDLCAAPEAKLTLHDIESRDALIEFFSDKKTVKAADLA